MFNLILPVKEGDYSKLSDNSTENKKQDLFGQFPHMSRKEWEEQASKDLKGKPVDRLKWRSYEGFELEPIYFREDIETLSYLTSSAPGEYPYTRGTKRSDNQWSVCEWISDKDIRDASKNAFNAIENGADAITFKSCFGQKNITGIPLHRLEDMDRLLDGVDLDNIRINFDPGVAGLEIFGLFLASAEKLGVPPGSLSGSLYYDPLRELAVHGELKNSIEQVYDRLAKLVNYTTTTVPHYRCVCVDSAEFHESGASMVQELGFALAKGVDYIANLTQKGLKIDTVASNMFFSFSVGSNYFMEVAKFRAARTLWAKLVKQFSPSEESSMEMIIHARTELWNKTVFDPYVNMIRATVESIVAAVSGCNSISVIPMDQTYEQPTEFARRMARNTQHIIKEESYFDRVIDPVAGSYYAENLTDKFIDHAFELFLEIEKNGGYTECLKSGFIQERIASIRQARNRDIEKRKLVLLGTNQYPDNQEKMLKYIKQGENVSPLVLSGNEVDESALGGPENLKYLFSNRNVTVGDLLTHGNESGHPGVKKIEPYRGAEIFEQIRFATEEFTGGNEAKRPGVFLLKFGNLASRNARASFSANFFGCAGFRIIEDLGYDDIVQGIDAAVKSGAGIVVLCSSDKEYGEINSDHCSAIRGSDSGVRIVIAGYPEDDIERLSNAGVDDFIHLRSNAVEILTKYQRILGIIS